MFEDLFDPSEAFSVSETLNSARVNAGIGAEPSEVGGFLELVDKSFEIIFSVNAADDGADKLGVVCRRGSGERAAEEAGGERHHFCFASTVTHRCQMWEGFERVFRVLPENITTFWGFSFQKCFVCA